MARIRAENFGGMAPRRSARLLPDNFGQLAQNTKLFSGELRGWAVPKQIQDFSGVTGDVKSVQRLPAEPGYPEQWLTFASDDVDFVRAPIVNDAFDRVYWTGEQPYPTYTTRGRIQAAQDPLRLGVPRPTTAPTIVVTGGSGDTTTRFYVYTFVSAYGEEGQPSDVGEQTGFENGSWDLSNMDTTVPDAAERNITLKRIYRTVVGETTTAFFFVAEIPLAQSTYNDPAPDSEVALNSLLESTTWAAPPDDLMGLVATANGFLVGFTGRDLYFSERWRPHAWPADYVVSTEFPIVGLGVFANSVAVTTSSAPYVVSGISPESASLTKMDTTEPCLSKRSIVSTPVGVYYASDNGLVLVSPAGYDLVTRPLLIEDTWRTDYLPQTLLATRYGTRYYATNPNFAFIFDHNEPNSAIVHVDELLSSFNQTLDPIDNLQTDYYNGDVLLIVDKKVYLWDAQDTTPTGYTWKSKEFEFPKPINMGAALVQSNAVRQFTDSFRASLKAYNASVLQNHSLHPLNHAPLGSSRRDVPLPTGILQPPKLAFAGSPLFDLQAFDDVSGVFKLTVWAGRELITTIDGLVAEEQIRLPSGVKSRSWSFQIESDTPCYSVTLAETGKELATT